MDNTTERLNYSVDSSTVKIFYSMENTTKVVYVRYQCSREVFMPVKLQFYIWLINGLLAFVFNMISVVLLATKNQLRENRFCMLSLCRSISGTGLSTCIIVISSIVLICDYDSNLALTGGCIASFAFLKAMQLASVVQTLIICIFQYCSTFTSISNRLLKFTSWKLVPVWHTICVVYIFFVFYIFSPDLNSYDCNEDIFFGKNWTIATCFTYIPLTSAFVAIIVFYCMTVKRLLLNHKKITTVVGKKEMAEKRLRKNVITLTIFICLSVMLVLPKVVALIIIPCSYDGFQLVKFVSGCVCGLKPLIDPIVYMCRIDEFRNRVIHICRRTKRIHPLILVSSSVIRTKDNERRL